MCKRRVIMFVVLVTLVSALGLCCLRQTNKSTATSLPSSTLAGASHVSVDEGIGVWQPDAFTGVITIKLNEPLCPDCDIRFFTILPDGSRVLYGFLNSVPLAGGEVVRLVEGGGAMHFVVTPDSSRGVYLALTPNLPELFGVSLMSGEVVKLNAPLAEDARVSNFSISPDSARVVYQVRTGTYEAWNWDLYSVPVGGGEVVELSIAALHMYDYTISPDSRRLVYLTGPDMDSMCELYSVPVAGGETIRLVPAEMGCVRDYAISLDSSRVVYRAYQDTWVDELYSVPLTGGTIVKLNAPLVNGGNVKQYAIASDNSRVVYRANQDKYAVDELYSVPLTGGTVVKLNGPMVYDGDVWDFAISSDNSRVVYLAEQDTHNMDELYSTPLAGGVAIKLNGPLLDDEDVRDLAISANSSRVVYRTWYYDSEVWYSELYGVSIMGGEVVRYSPPLQGYIHEYTISPDSRRVVYLAEQDAYSELFAVLLTGGEVIKLNPTLVTGGYVTEQVISPDGNQVVYVADQEVKGRYELYTTFFWPHRFDVASYLPLTLR